MLLLKEGATKDAGITPEQGEQYEGKVGRPNIENSFTFWGIGGATSITI